MKTTFIGMLCLALIAASTTPSAAGARETRKDQRATRDIDGFRRSNASVALRAGEAQSMRGSQYDGAMSAPAGR